MIGSDDFTAATFAELVAAVETAGNHREALTHAKQPQFNSGLNARYGRVMVPHFSRELAEVRLAIARERHAEKIIAICREEFGDASAEDLLKLRDRLSVRLDREPAEVAEMTLPEFVNAWSRPSAPEAVKPRRGEQRAASAASRRATLLSAILATHHYTADGVRRDAPAMTTAAAAAQLRQKTKKQHGTSGPTMTRAWQSLFPGGYAEYLEHVNNPALDQKLRRVLTEHLPPDRGASLNPEFHSEQAKMKF